MASMIGDLPRTLILRQSGQRPKLVWATKKNDDGTITIEYQNQQYNVKAASLREVNP